MATNTGVSSPRPALSPATPRYILRGHASPIHALHFFGCNSGLVSADADGWIVIWDVVTKRPRAVWKAHEGAILEVKGFSYSSGKGPEVEIYTHGRDHKLRVWRMSSADEELLDKTLPVESAKGLSQPDTVAQPWLIHSLPVNALNFCAFSLCFVPGLGVSEGGNNVQISGPKAEIEVDIPSALPTQRKNDPVLFAVPNALNSGAIDIFHLPSEKRVSTIPANASVETGMVMAVNIFLAKQGDLYVASGYEDGHVMIHIQRGPLTISTSSHGTKGKNSKGKKPSPTSETWNWEKVYAGRSHTQPVLSLDIPPAIDYLLTSSADSLIVKHPIPNLPEPKATKEQEGTPLKILNTKHAGQQGLQIRPDDKVFATAGWDARVRVYSCKTMKELAVLKWHKEGCYTVAFAEILDNDGDGIAKSESKMEDSSTTSPSNEGDQQLGQDLIFRPGAGSLKAVQQQRSQKAQQTHWLAAGSKDGKISLWDIY